MHSFPLSSLSCPSCSECISTILHALRLWSICMGRQTCKHQDLPTLGCAQAPHNAQQCCHDKFAYCRMPKNKGGLFLLPGCCYRDSSPAVCAAAAGVCLLRVPVPRADRCRHRVPQLDLNWDEDTDCQEGSCRWPAPGPPDAAPPASRPNCICSDGRILFAVQEIATGSHSSPHWTIRWPTQSGLTRMRLRHICS